MIKIEILKYKKNKMEDLKIIKKVSHNPWYCDGCNWYLYLNKKETCPLCNNKKTITGDIINYPSNESIYNLPFKNKTQKLNTTPKKRKIKIYNVGNINKTNNLILPEKNQKSTRIVCISDTHTKHWEIPYIPEGDILIHSGDFTLSGKDDEIIDFIKFFESQPHKYKIIIAGNHDITLQTDWYKKHFWRFSHNKEGPILLDAENLKNQICSKFIYLEDSEININGIRIYGTPWTELYHDWAFMLKSEELNNIWELIPSGIDILITHGPPFGCGLSYVIKNNEKIDFGDKGLSKHIEKIKPCINIFGHVHESYGTNRINGITYINCSTVTKKFKPINNPIVIDIL